MDMVAYPQQSQITGNRNGNYFIYVAVTGGGMSIGSTNFTQDGEQIDNSGYESVVIGHSSYYAGAFSTGASYYGIGEVSVLGPAPNVSVYSGSGLTSVSGTFSVSTNSLVVLVSGASNDFNPQVTSSAGFVVGDFVNQTYYSLTLAFASVAPGTYSFSVDYNTSQGGNPNSCAVLAAVYAFPYASTVTTTPPSSGGGSSSPSSSSYYQITFTESGLPQGKVWSVTVNGKQGSSSSAQLTFQEKSGDLISYSVAPVQGYSAQPSTGTFTVTGNVDVPIAFSPSTAPSAGSAKVPLIYSPTLVLLVGVVVALGASLLVSVMARGEKK